MRILVTGASGFIGHACLSTLVGHTIQGTYRSRGAPGLVRLDLLDARAVNECLDNFRPEAVVHCAARPSVDWCEENPADARVANCDTTLNLVLASRAAGARVVFLSTDYVFDGDSGPYREGEIVRPLNVYGRLKLEMEEAVLEADPGSLVVRTTNVYGFDPESRNFIMGILPALARGTPVRVADDQYGTPTLVSDLCRHIRRLVELQASGVIHVAGPDYVHRADWARAAATEFGLDPRGVAGVSTTELGQAASRPLRAGLLCDRLRSLGFPPLLGLGEGLREMRADRLSSTGSPS